MARIWVLDTDTKGTGAEMVPLDRVLEKPAPSSEPFFVPPKPRPREPEPAEPRAPRRFRIVDVVSQQVLAEQAPVREALAVLRDVRSSVDVRVYVWEPKRETWRLLTLDEQRLLWDRRELATPGDARLTAFRTQASGQLTRGPHAGPTAETGAPGQDGDRHRSPQGAPQ